MSLAKKQQRFTQRIGQLITMAYKLGYALTRGDGYRDPRVHGEWGQKESYAAAYSCHKLRLADDFNLWVDGKLIEGDHPAWHTLGNYWEYLDMDSAWGGRWGDYGHFSFEYQGYK